MSNEPPTPQPDSFAMFETVLSKLVAVPKKVLNRKVEAFKRRRRRKRL